MKFVFAFIAVFAVLVAFVHGGDKSVCLLPKEVGPCRKSADVFFYNKETQQCEEFIYGGCHGNENRFETKEECDKLCLTTHKEEKEN